MKYQFNQYGNTKSRKSHNRYSLAIRRALVSSFKNRTLSGLSVIFIMAACMLILTPSFVHAITPNTGKTWYTPADPQATYLNILDANSNPIHVLNNTTGILADLAATTPGDYCNSYKAGIDIKYPQGYDQSPSTGFNPGGNLNDWQEGDVSSTNVCQVRQGTWGFKVSGAANNNCQPGIVCGMHHFARLSNGLTNLPWSDSFGTSPKPALTFSLTVKPKTVSGNSVGYICPLLEEVATGNIIELCLTEWQSGVGFPQFSEANNGITCDSPSTWSLDTAWTTFNNGRLWATKRAGSADTYTYTLSNSNVPVNMSATISAQNLENVIAKINTSGGQPVGCGRNPSLSTDVRNYALIGFEQGVEGGSYSLIGESVANEQFSTTTDALFPNEKLESGQTMYSSNYSDTVGTGYRIVMQADGNLVVYPANSTAAVWASGNTVSPTQGSYLQMQADGNLVVYKPDNTPTNWHHQGVSGSYATIQGDGNFVIYQGGSPEWSWK